MRRGDFVALNWASDPGIYREKLLEFAWKTSGDWHLFVFSDDIPWCRQHAEEMGFDNFQEVTYVEGNVHGKNYVDMQLMTMCEAMIISSSSFGFLATLLNPRFLYFALAEKDR